MGDQVQHRRTGATAEAPGGQAGPPGGQAGPPGGQAGARPGSARGAARVTELSDDELTVFLDLSSELFGVFDPQGGLVWCNPSVAAVLGYEPQELTCVELASLVHPDDLGAPTDDLEDFPRDGSVLTLTVRCRTKTGDWRWLEWSGSWEEPSGLLYGTARDVTEQRRARAKVLENERLIQAILDHSEAAVWVKDLDGRYAMVNDSFLRIVGKERAALVGKRVEELWPEGAVPTIEADRAALVEGPSLTSDVVVEVDGASRTYMLTRFPVLDADGWAAGIAAIATDITERSEIRRRLIERERLLDTIVSACPDIVTILDRRGRVQAVSLASSRILGYDIGEPVHEELEALVHPDDIPTIYRDYGALLDRSAPQLDLRYRVRHRDGHWVTLDTRGRAVVDDDGRAAGAVVVSRDVTADLAFEQELEAVLTEAERASTAKSEFLSRMSHELRTPLNSVLGFAQLLGMDNLDDQQEEAVGHIMRAGQHLLNLIDEVLDIARIESGRLDILLEPVAVAEVVGDAVNLSGPLAEKGSVALEVDLRGCPPATYVSGDRQRLLQVLLNLLSNAVKYNQPEGRVVVDVSVPEGEGRVLIAVADTGPGIAPEDADRVFLPFDRLGAERSGVEGTGVGLALAKHLVEQMGGTLTLESDTGRGATFTVSLPSAVPPEATRPGSIRAVRSRLSGDGLRVLHIEDNLANLELVEQILSRSGSVELRAAMYGSLGVELAREHRPDLVLLDLHLPDMTGSEVLERMRQDPDLADVPVVIVSADATPAQVRNLQTSGVLAYLTKPIDVAELLRIIELVSAGTAP